MFCLRPQHDEATIRIIIVSARKIIIIKRRARVRTSERVLFMRMRESVNVLIPSLLWDSEINQTQLMCVYLP